MINAKNELLSVLRHVNAGVRCATIVHKPDCFANGTEVSLKVGHTSADFEEFLGKLDFEYHDGFGLQELYGYVWLNDGTWLGRSEYYGVTSWEHQSCPDVPGELMFD